MRTVSIISIILVIMMISSLSAAEINSIAAPKCAIDFDQVIVPIELNNTQNMAALDLPIQFSDGVTLEEVSFAGTRAEEFDFAIAKIDNENNTVILGMIPMVYGEKTDLTPGEGEIAKLIFRVDDLSLETLELSTVSMEGHSPMFVYTEVVNGEGQTMVSTPEFSGAIIALADGVRDEPGVVPVSFALLQNAPNPFNPTTNIAFDLPAASQVRLEILNVLGQRVKTLVDEVREAGSHSVTWDGRDDYGTSTASGVYFYRISAGENQAVKKMMMLK
ncbi:MAG: T9SS type A sorting domain-containing protein [candidate division Zixibacteria bacterium]|nr:T9SS type A sorting domain-containing protein [candidate division Zixibacteria bacterium]